LHALADHLLLQVYGPDKALPYVVPSPNVRIECPLALVDKVLENRPAAAQDAAGACFFHTQLMHYVVY
jgi:ABC-type sulfate transport system substrate-binding protein